MISAPTSVQSFSELYVAGNPSTVIGDSSPSFDIAKSLFSL